MQLTTLALGLLSATAAAASGSAYELPRHPAPALAEAVAAPRPRGLEARGTAECTSVASTVLPRITDFPTPPAAVESYLATASVTTTDPCVDPVVTGSVGSAFSTWAAEYSSWQDDHVTDFRALWAACSDVPEVAAALPTGADVCSSLVERITGAEGAADATSNPAAPRETGAIAAAALFAGAAAVAAW